MLSGLRMCKSILKQGQWVTFAPEQQMRSPHEQQRIQNINCR